MRPTSSWEVSFSTPSFLLWFSQESPYERLWCANCMSPFHEMRTRIAIDRNVRSVRAGIIGKTSPFRKLMSRQNGDWLP